jgi:hypothetical protein
MSKYAALGLAAAIISAPLGASSYGVELRGNLAVSCRVSSDVGIIDVSQGISDLGKLREFCNNAAGYDLYLDYAPQLAGAVVTVDGTPLTLGVGGTAALAAESGPAMRERSLQIDLTEAQNPDSLAIAFRLVPR